MLGGQCRMPALVDGAGPISVRVTLGSSLTRSHISPFFHHSCVSTPGSFRLGNMRTSNPYLKRQSFFVFQIHTINYLVDLLSHGPPSGPRCFWHIRLYMLKWNEPPDFYSAISGQPRMGWKLSIHSHESKNWSEKHEAAKKINKRWPLIQYCGPDK